MYNQISSSIFISKAIVVSQLRTWVGFETVENSRGKQEECRSLCSHVIDMQCDYALMTLIETPVSSLTFNMWQNCEWNGFYIKNEYIRDNTCLLRCLDTNLFPQF